MVSRADFDRLPEDQKFDLLYRCAASAERASEALAAAMELFQKRLATIETGRPDRD